MLGLRHANTLHILQIIQTGHVWDPSSLQKKAIMNEVDLGYYFELVLVAHST